MGEGALGDPNSGRNPPEEHWGSDTGYKCLPIPLSPTTILRVEGTPGPPPVTPWPNPRPACPTGPSPEPRNSLFGRTPHRGSRLPTGRRLPALPRRGSGRARRGGPRLPRRLLRAARARPRSRLGHGPPMHGAAAGGAAGVQPPPSDAAPLPSGRAAMGLPLPPLPPLRFLPAPQSERDASARVTAARPAPSDLPRGGAARGGGVLGRGACACVRAGCAVGWASGAAAAHALLAPPGVCRALPLPSFPSSARAAGRVLGEEAAEAAAHRPGVWGALTCGGAAQCPSGLPSRALREPGFPQPSSEGCGRTECERLAWPSPGTVPTRPEPEPEGFCLRRGVSRAAQGPGKRSLALRDGSVGSRPAAFRIETPI